MRVCRDQTASLLASIDGLRNDSDKNRYSRPLFSSKGSFFGNGEEAERNANRTCSIEICSEK